MLLFFIEELTPRTWMVVLFSGGTLEMERGGIHLVQYATIEGLLRLGDVELV